MTINTGGIFQNLEYLSVNDVDNIRVDREKQDAYVVTNNSILAGTLCFTRDTLEYKCEPSFDNNNGVFYEQSLFGSIPKISFEKQKKLSELQNGCFIIFPHLKNGDVIVMGSKENPCSIEIEAAVSANLEQNSYQVTFKCLSTHLPYFKRLSY